MLGKHSDFDGPTLSRAIAATFERRHTSAPERREIAAGSGIEPSVVQLLPYINTAVCFAQLPTSSWEGCFAAGVARSFSRVRKRF